MTDLVNYPKSGFVRFTLDWITPEQNSYMEPRGAAEIIKGAASHMLYQTQLILAERSSCTGSTFYKSDADLNAFECIYVAWAIQEDPDLICNFRNLVCGIALTTSAVARRIGLRSPFDPLMLMR